MSTIKLEFDSADSAVVAAVGALTNALLGNNTAASKPAAEIEVLGAEEIKTPAAAPAPKPRPSRAKPKPQAEPEPEAEDDEQDEDFADEAAEDDDEAITIEDVREMQAKKVGVHKLKIKEILAGFDATGISSLDAKHFEAYYNALAKLK